MPTAPSWDASGAWTTIFAEDFAEGSLDLTRWHNGWFGSGSGTSGPVNSLETAVYSTANVSLSGGYLNMLLTPTANGGKANTGSLINTDPAQVSPGFAFVHGAAEARVFVPATADGTQAANWIAWWVNGPDGTGRGEFDVIEALHGSIESHIPTAGNPGFSGPNEPYTGWHNFGVNWSTGQVVTFYYDGVSIGSANVTNTGPMYLVINNTVGTNSVAYVPASGITMLVDWAYVWQPGGSGSSASGSPSTGITLTPTASSATSGNTSSDTTGIRLTPGILGHPIFPGSPPGLLAGTFP